MLSLKVAFSECDFLFLKRLLTSQKSWCHRQINMEVWKEFFVIYNTYSGVWSPWLKSLQYYNHFQSTIANQRGKPLGRCWSKVGVFPPPPLNCHYSHIFPLFHIISLHPWKVGDTRQYQHLLYHCCQKNIVYNFKFSLAIQKRLAIQILWYRGNVLSLDLKSRKWNVYIDFLTQKSNIYVTLCHYSHMFKFQSFEESTF